MLSKAVVKYIKSLQVKKYRNQHQAFVVEGAKSVLELMQADYQLEHLFVTDTFYSQHKHLLDNGFLFDIVKEEELVRAGSYTTNNAALAVANMRRLPPLTVSPQELVLALDDIRDPGNLGTIIRIADWYGINKVICSEACADLYNPKVISATMGSFTRVKVYFLNLDDWLQQLGDGFSIYGASLDGHNIHIMQLRPQGIVVMGNEANGIRPEVAQHVNQLLKIPAFGQAESLNVATATAVIIDNFRRSDKK